MKPHDPTPWDGIIWDDTNNGWSERDPAVCRRCGSMRWRHPVDGKFVGAWKPPGSSWRTSIGRSYKYPAKFVDEDCDVAIVQSVLDE